MSEEQASVETDRIREKETIRQAQNGSQAAYSELYQRHFAAIQQYIDKRVDGRCDAEDLTQTVFLKAWQALHDYQPTATPFRAWLYRIAHNIVIDHYRSQRRTLVWDDLALATDPRGAPEMLLLDRERQETVQRAIALLRPAYQEIIIQRFLRNMEYAEMAAELGYQVNNLRVLQHRALEALRRVLTHELTLGIAVALTIMLLGRYTVVEAAQALPGDGLYPLRTIVEQTSLFLADDATDIRLHTDFAAQRIAELRKLSQQARIQDMVTTTSNWAMHIQAAADQLTIVTQADPLAHRELTDQFEQALQQQSVALVDLAASVLPPVRPTFQPALTILFEVQTQLREQDDQPPVPSAEPIYDAPTKAPVTVTAEPVAPNPTAAETQVVPLPTSRGNERPGQLTPLATDVSQATLTPEHAKHDPSTSATRTPSSDQAPSTYQARARQSPVKGANAAVTPTSVSPAVAPQTEKHKAPVTSRQPPDTDAPSTASVPTPSPANPPAPTNGEASVAPDQAQDHKGAVPAQAKTEAAPAHTQPSEGDTEHGAAPRSDHASDASESKKDHRPKL